MIAPARLAAYRVLRAVHRGRASLPAALAHAREDLPDPRDRALAADIATGVLRWRQALDHLIARATARPITKLDAEVLDVLRLGAYQVLHLTRVPVAAVVSDAVELTRRAGKGSASGLVTAVLRALERERATPALPAEPTSSGDRDAALEFLSVTLSHPRWLAERWLDRYGFEAAVAWARFNNSPAPLTLRVNRLRTTVPALVDLLKSHGVETQVARYAPYGLIVTSGNPLRTPLADRGLFVVQDEASQLVSALVNVQPGERVLDACASPGGKTLAFVEAAGPDGTIVAADARPARIDLLRRTVARAGAAAVRIVQLDLRRGLPFGPIFDVVLVDVPCSGLGTIRRDPDIRWRRSEEELERLADVEGSMLEAASAGVRPGGRVVYATCSSEPEENDVVVDRFLRRCPWFRAVDPRETGVAPGVAAVLDGTGRLRTLPHVHGLEGFFAAVLVRSP